MSCKRPIISREVTIRDVAEAAGVSVSLVSFVLNAKRGPNGEYLCSASQSTARRIAEAAESLGYHRNKAASALRTGHTDTIGLIVSDISNTCFGSVCRKVENLSAESGYLTLIGSTDDRLEKFSALADKFLYCGVDGVIVAPCQGSEDIVHKFLKRGIPTVLFDRDLPEVQGVGRVMLDNEKAGRMAARHLLSKGCTRPALVRYSTDVSTIRDKEKGFVEEAVAAGAIPQVKIVARETMTRDIVSVIRSLKEEGADAVVFPSNTITIAGVSAINTLGYSVPADIRVVGFDQENRYGIFDRGISFLDQPTNLVAEYSFRMLEAAIKEDKPMESIVVEPLLTTSSK